MVNYSRIDKLSPVPAIAYRRARAIALLAPGGVTLEEVAKQIEVNPGTIERWHASPVFRAELALARNRCTNAILDSGIADKRERIERANERWLQLARITEERADHFQASADEATRNAAECLELAQRLEADDKPDEADAMRRQAKIYQSEASIPGASTGLLVKNIKSIGPSGASMIVEEWALDSELINAEQKLAAEVSAELGQRPRESSGSNVTVQAVIMLPRPATSAPVVIDLEPTK